MIVARSFARIHETNLKVSTSMLWHGVIVDPGPVETRHSSIMAER